MDIGVGESSAQVDHVASRPGPERRSLPRWALVVLALAVGWILGVITTGPTSSTGPTAAEPDPVPTAAATVTPVGATPFPIEDSDYVRADSSNPLGPTGANPNDDAGQTLTQALLQGAATSNVVPGEVLALDNAGLVTVVMVQAPLRGVAIPADIQVLSQGVTTRLESEDLLIAGATQGVIGQGDQRLVMVEDKVVFMALNSVMVLDPATMDAPVEVAKGIYLLPGSDPSRVWVVGSGSRSVVDVDVRRQIILGEYELEDIGVPLGSYRGGLVVAPADGSLGKFALWSPRSGLEPLDIAANASFVDAGGNTVVIATADGLATYNAVTGAVTQTDLAITPSQQHRALVSPNGDQLAIVQRGTIAELPTVVVVDTATGETVDEFATAFEWQLQWISNQDMLFMGPLTNGVRVMLRDTVAKQDRAVADLATPNYWVTIAN